MVHLRPIRGGWQYLMWARLLREVIPLEVQLAFLCTVRCSKAYKPSGGAHQLPRDWIDFLLEKLGNAAWSLPAVVARPREFTDSLRGLASKTMPDILPPESDIVQLTEDEIEQRVAAYVGVDVATLHTTLYVSVADLRVTLICVGIPEEAPQVVS